MIDYAAQPSVLEACARLITAGAELGTGYLVTADRLATCHHVVENVKPDTEPIDCRFGDKGIVQRKAYLIKSDPSTDSAILRLDKPVTATPLLLLAGPIAARNDFWALGFPGFTAATLAEVRRVVTLRGIITNFHQVSPENIDGTLELSIVDFQARVPESVGGFSGSPILMGRYVIGHLSSVLGAKGARKAPHLAHAYAVRAEGVLRLLGMEPARVTEAWLNKQRDLAIEWLKQRRLYVEEWSVPRADAEELAARFLASPARVLPIIGASGNGKTFLLGRLALASPVPGIFVRSSQIRPNSELSDAVAEELRGAAVGAGPDIQAWLKSLRDQGRWVIWLDALNELSLPIGAACQWFERAVRWLDQVGAALVVSCRVEYWDFFAKSIPENWRFNQFRSIGVGHSKERRRVEESDEAIVLGAFTVDEASMARQAYQIDMEWPELREPMFLRVAAEQALGAVGMVSRWSVIEALIERACQAVANIMNLELLPAQIEGFVEVLAKKCMSGGPRSRTQISIAQAQKVLQQNGRLLAALIREGVILQSDRRISFKFDWVAEHLYARTLDPDAVIAAYDPRKFETQSALRATLERLSYEGDTRRVERCLEVVVERARRDVEIAVACSAVARPMQFMDMIADALSRRATRWPDREASNELYQAIVELRLPIQSRVTLTRILVPQSDGWPWGAGDEFVRQRWWLSGDGLFKVFRNLLAEDLAATASALIGWLGDYTLMHHDEASVRDVAVAVLLYAADEDPNPVIKAIASRWPDTAWLLHIVLKRSPDAAEDVLRQWIAIGGEQEQAVAADCAAVLLQARASVVPLVLGLYNQCGPNDRIKVAAALIRVGHFDEEIVEVCGIGIQTGRLWPSECLPLLTSHFSKVMGWLEERAEVAAPEVLSALSSVSHPEANLRRVVALIARLLENAPHPAALAIEQLLRKVSVSSAHTSGLWELAVRLLDGGPSGRRCLTYFAYGVRAKDPFLQEELGKLLARTASDTELESLIWVGARNCAPTLFVALEDALGRGSPLFAAICILSAGQRLLGGAYMDALINWVRQHATTLPGVREWLERIDTGEEPESAATVECERLEALYRKGDE